MFRPISLLGAAALAALTATAHADSTFPAGKRVGDRLVMVLSPPEQFNSSPAAEVSNVIWLNRCTGSCMVTGGTVNDARQHVAAYLPAGQYEIGEYKNNEGQIGPAADDEWQKVVKCVQELYSPFDITVTDVKPTTGNYTEAVVGGISGDVGLGPSIGGVAAFSCAPRDNVLSFSFSNSAFYFAPGNPQKRIWDVCWVIGQETAHNFSLDHAYEFQDASSACNDPMTYRTDCGGQKFFRNKPAKCGEETVRECYLGQSQCGGAGGTIQNSHQKLLSIFGPGQSLIPAPTVQINSPAGNGTLADGGVVAFQAGSRRGIEKSELHINGRKWAETKGAAFGQNGQANPSDYSIRLPGGVPNGVMDLQIKAYDDLGVVTASQTVTVTKGAPCANADSCAEGQKCEAGKCLWDAPTGKLGDSCTYQQFCESDLCVETTEGGYCSQECIVGSVDGCPDGFECLAAGASGACLPTDTGGGCCSVGGRDAVWLHGGLSLAVLGLVMRRRRRRDRL